MDKNMPDGRSAPGRFRRRRAGPVRMALGLAAALPILLGNAEPQARPALWVVSDSDTTIYLFGTFHALDGKSDWFGSVRPAFERSDSLVLETLLPDGPVRMSEPAPDGARKAIAAARAGGMEVAFGADIVLRQAADAAGKRIEGLERFEEQVAMYRSLAPTAPVPTGAGQPNPLGEDSKAAELARLMAFLQSAWTRGDSRQFETVMDALSASSPAAYQTMFVERNTHWAAWIGKRLETPGTVFVAVGTGHLVGRDSVQAKLAQRGIRSNRIG